MDFRILGNQKFLSSRQIENTIIIHPMECNDANDDGSPSDSTYKRYKEFVTGGAGMIWFETISVSEQGRTNRAQLLLNNKTVGSFHALLSNIDRQNKVIKIAQLSHGGKYSISKEIYSIFNNYEQLDIQKEYYISAALLADEAGFDGIDLKLCHGFLFGDILFNTDKYLYLNDYKERIKYILGVIKDIRKKSREDFIFAARIDISDFLLEGKFCFSNLIYLVENLKDVGVSLYSFTIKKYYIKSVNISLEKIMETYREIVSCVTKLKCCVSDLIIVSPGLTMFGVDAPYIGKELLEKKSFDLIGFGRQALAYPSFANDILFCGGLKRDKCCILCGKCSNLRRTGQVVRCVK